MHSFHMLFVLATTFNFAFAHHRQGHTNSGSAATDTAFDTTATDVAGTRTVFETSLLVETPVTTVTPAAASTSSSSTDSNKNKNNNNNNSGSLVIDPDVIQSASDSDGFANIEAGQSPSLKDATNFVNFCSGQTLTNGSQVTSGSCNGIVMGQIPSSNNMISTIITNPAPGDNLPSNTDFTVTIQVSNLQAGTFTNPNTTYYSAPQTLKNGQVVGHTHITIQTLGNNMATSQPPDASKFVFFKGVNNAGNGQGGLSADVIGGLPAGVYRVCTMTSSANHQPVLMPVAQRGAQDDCTKFTVSDQNNNNNNNNNDNSNNGNSDSNTSTSTETSTSTSTDASASTSTGKSNKKGHKGGAATSVTETATGTASLTSEPTNVQAFVREGARLRFARRQFIS